MTNGHWGVCRSAPPIPEPGEPRNRYLGAGGADFDKGDFVTGFPYPRSAERPRRGRSVPFWNLFPCASSFAMETGNQKHKTTGAVVGKCALLYRSGVLLASNASVGTNAKKHLLGEPKPHSGKAGFTQFLLTQPELARGGLPSGAVGSPPGTPIRIQTERPPPGPMSGGGQKNGLSQPMELRIT